MSYHCGQCEKPLYWSETEGWCHVGQKRGAMWKCPKCGYTGDLTDNDQGHWRPGHVPGFDCPRCASPMDFDHHANITGDEHQKLFEERTKAGLGYLGGGPR
jgi:hypothetical protein